MHKFRYHSAKCVTNLMDARFEIFSRGERCFTTCQSYCKPEGHCKQLTEPRSFVAQRSVRNVICFLGSVYEITFHSWWYMSLAVCMLPLSPFEDDINVCTQLVTLLICSLHNYKITTVTIWRWHQSPAGDPVYGQSIRSLLSPFQKGHQRLSTASDPVYVQSL